MSFPPPSDKQARVLWLAATGLAVAILLTLVAGFVWGLGQLLHLLSPVLWPLAVAGVLAYLLDPVVDLLERKRMPRPGAIVCVFALALVILLAISGSVAPQLIKETHQLALRVPGYAARVKHRVEDWINHPPEIMRRFLAVMPESPVATNAPPDTNAPASLTATNAPDAAPGDVGDAPAWWASALDKKTLQSATGIAAKIAPKIGSWLFGQVARVASWFGVLAGLALIPVYAFYFLLEKKGIESRWTDYLPLSRSAFKDELVFVLRAINGYLIVFFRGQVLVALCDGILYTIGFAIIGLPYAVLLGVMATFLTMIPFLGAITTCATALVIAFVQFGDWKHPALVLAVFGVVQTLEGFVIQPKIIGDRVGLHPLTIIVAVMVGTTMLGGILGGILAIPLTAALRVVMFRYVWKTPEKSAR